MVYKHAGRSFKGRETEKIEGDPNAKKRYYVLNFVCIKCDTFNRLRDLELDFMGHFHCPDCKGSKYTIRKVAISKQNILSKDDASIVMVEHIHIKGAGFDNV